MEPFTMIALLIGAGLVVKAVLNWSTVKDWLSAHKVPQGTGKILRQRMASGQYTIVGNVFAKQGTRVSQHTWRARQLDAELEEKFRKAGGKIVVKL
jgi:hypothetical protein